MADELGQIQVDIGELRANVSVIKTEIQDMKHSVTNAIDKISNSMAILATVTERLNHNVEEHKLIHDRIDDVEKSQEQHIHKLDELRTSHLACIEQRKVADEQKKNSIWNKVKDRIVEYLFITLIVLVIFILFTHFADFVKFMTTQSNVSTIVPK